MGTDTMVRDAPAPSTPAIKVKLKGLLNPTQMAFHRSVARNRLFAGGRGTGKTTVGCMEALLSSLQPGARGGVFAPTYSMLRDATIPEVFKLFPAEIIKDYKRGTMEMELVNGSTIVFRSLDNYPTLASLILAWVWIDEGAISSREAWQLLKARTRQPGYNHRRWITSTPQGRNWLWDEFGERERKGYELFTATIYENAPNLPEGYIEELEDSYSGLFAKQELLGEFVAFEGLIYDFTRTQHVMAAPEGAEASRAIGGIDWGFQNPMAVVVAQEFSDGHLHQAEEFYERHQLVDDNFVAQLREYEAEYGKATWYCDPSNPDYIMVLVNAGLDARPAPNRVDPGLNAVGVKLKVLADGHPRLTVAPSCAHSIAEFETYHKDDKDKVVKQKDHLMDAWRYLVYGSMSQGSTEGRKGR